MIVFIGDGKLMSSCNPKTNLHFFVLKFLDVQPLLPKTGRQALLVLDRFGIALNMVFHKFHHMHSMVAFPFDSLFFPSSIFPI